MPLGCRLGRAGALPFLLLLRERVKWELPARCRLPFPAPPTSMSLPNSHRTFHDVRIRGRLRSLATACYPPVVPDLRIEDQGRIRGPGHEGVALVDVAVVLALAPLPVRGQEVESVDAGHRPLRALLVPAHAGSGRGLLTATARDVEALGLDPRIDTALGVTRSRRQRTRSPARRGDRRDRSRSHALPNRSRSSGRLPGSPARLRAEETGRLARREIQEGVGAVASQPPVVSEAVAAVTPVVGGAALTALPSAVQDLARFFLSLSGSSSLGAIGGIAGVTASAAGSGGAVCPSTAAGGAVITCATAAPSAGSGVRCARRLLRLVQSLLVLRLRCLLELVVRLLPLLCLVCLACLVLCSVRWISSLVGVGVARPVVGSTGETCLRWRFPSPVASSRRPGSSTGLPRFSRFWTRFSSAHFWSLLHWRRLSVVLPAAMVDCCLSSLRAGVCSLLWRWRISARVLMVACLPLLRGRGSAPSPIPWPILDLTLVLSSCKNLAWLVSWRWWLVLG